VQKKFLKYLLFQLNINIKLSYLELCKNFNLQPLYHRREICSLVFINKVFNNKVDCPPIVSCISFYIPSRSLRRRNLFYNRSRINIRKQSPMIRAQTLANNVDLDFFINSSHFKRNVKQLYNSYL
jgi:hypothetical protein